MSDVEHEIVEQHRLIEAVLRGTAADEALTQFADVLSPRFQLYWPDGEVTGRDEIVAGLVHARGSEPDVTVRIEAVRLLAADTATVVATYEEYQTSPEQQSVRRSTAVFGRDPSVRHGLRWEHLHETWKAAPAR